MTTASITRGTAQMIKSRSWILTHATKLVVGGQVFFEVPFDSWKEETAWQYFQLWLPSPDLKSWRLHDLSPMVDDSWADENGSGKFYTLAGVGLISFPIVRLFFAARKMKDQEATETRGQKVITDAFRKYFEEKAFLLTPFAQVYPELKKILKLDGMSSPHRKTLMENPFSNLLT